MAFLGRTSNERLQDPIASMRRQVRKSHAWLPAGCQIVAYYWDVESGGDDLEDRGRKDTWQVAAAAGIPRDGGIADLLNQAKSPVPDFAFVVCENIERSARDTYNSLKLERELQDQGIPLFATDEPFSVEGINATTILVRRVKQGVAEWFRLQLLPVTEDSDEGGAGDADVGVRESPAVVVCGGALWGWCRWLWVRCRGYVSVTSVMAARAACSSTMALLLA